MEENKTYSVVGQVTIGTDEYRDLIESRMKAETSRDKYMSDGWEKDKEIKKLKEQVESLTAKMERCENFIKKNIKPNMAELSEDSITLVMSMFGEK